MLPIDVLVMSFAASVVSGLIEEDVVCVVSVLSPPLLDELGRKSSIVAPSSDIKPTPSDRAVTRIGGGTSSTIRSDFLRKENFDILLLIACKARQ